VTAHRGNPERGEETLSRAHRSLELRLGADQLATPSRRTPAPEKHAIKIKFLDVLDEIYQRGEHLFDSEVVAVGPEAKSFMFFREFQLIRGQGISRKP
jgi:hypothetical protein